MLTGAGLTVNVSDLNSSEVGALAQYARGRWFESRLRLDFLPPFTYKKRGG